MEPTSVNNYAFTLHAKTAMSTRSLTQGLVLSALRSPDMIVADRYDPAIGSYCKAVPGCGNLVLRVVVDRATRPETVITAYIDRRIRDAWKTPSTEQPPPCPLRLPLGEIRRSELLIALLHCRRKSATRVAASST